MSDRLPPALVLAAGIGTRLRPLSLTRAKPAVPVAGRPLVCRILDWLRREGVERVVLNLHHRPESITREVGDGAHLGVPVRYSWEPSLLGSAGGPRHALPLLDAARIIIVNGDTLTDVDLTRLVEHHARGSAAVTLAVIPNPAPDRYGGVEVTSTGLIAGFTPPGTTGGEHHFVGAQVVDTALLRAIPDGTRAESIGGLYADMLRDGSSVAAWRCDAGFMDVGTPLDYVATDRRLRGPADAAIGARARIDPSALVIDTLAWDDVSIGPGAELRECVVADGAVVPGDLRLERMAIAPADGHEPGPRERLIDGLIVAPLEPERPDESATPAGSPS